MRYNIYTVPLPKTTAVAARMSTWQNKTCVTRKWKTFGYWRVFRALFSRWIPGVIRASLKCRKGRNRKDINGKLTDPHLRFYRRHLPLNSTLNSLSPVYLGTLQQLILTTRRMMATRWLERHTRTLRTRHDDWGGENRPTAGLPPYPANPPADPSRGHRATSDPPSRLLVDSVAVVEPNWTPPPYVGHGVAIYRIRSAHTA